MSKMGIDMGADFGSLPEFGAGNIVLRATPLAPPPAAAPPPPPPKPGLWARIKAIFTGKAA